MTPRVESPQMRRIRENKERRRTELPAGHAQGVDGPVEMSRWCSRCRTFVLADSKDRCIWCDQPTVPAADVLGEEAAVGELAESGAALPLSGEPERAVTSPSTVRIGSAEREILDFLEDGPKRLAEVVAKRGVHEQTVMQQLQTLLKKGLVRRVSRGLYELEDSGREPRSDDTDTDVAPRAAEPPDASTAGRAPASAAAPAEADSPSPSRPEQTDDDGFPDETKDAYATALIAAARAFADVLEQELALL